MTPNPQEEKPELDLITNWISEKRKDIEILNRALKITKKLNDNSLKSDLERIWVDWVLKHSQAIKEMEKIKDER